ncbi:PaaI family thioesterase [Aspergillus saccharolyticus JOP 1030-1]|uniref:Thioesterase family protein n=1 Tax=Aspergillus saccharolyticus JOP 1030-1 TaxID=1450539 RepID=A0A318Z7J2_9EURO|nr:thioesterase family protein [Aspergillus saccharolyticus JOP 1030-1]PYH43089.1 thioesterase family protein [Aspergillus saccharolyticus JOP 1030-1]
MTPSETLTHVRAVSAAQRANSPIYAHLLSDITITSATEGHLLATIPVGAPHINSKGGLHGTMTACLVDWAAGMVIATYGGSYTGVSTDLHVSYVASAREGDVLEVTGRATKVGGTMAFVAVEVARVVDADGERVVVASGLHSKYVKQRST